MWRLTTSVCFLVAIDQVLWVGAFVVGVGILAWKAGNPSNVASVSTFNALSFLVVSGMLIAAALLASRRVQVPFFRRLGIAAATLLSSGALVWGLLLVSPVIFLVHR